MMTTESKIDSKDTVDTIKQVKCVDCKYRSDIRDDTGLWQCNKHHFPIGDPMLNNYCYSGEKDDR